MNAEMQTYRSGFVTIIGCPNVGKSTLLNTLIGQKIAIVSDRAQTTRNKITGVLTRPNYQLVFLDTPGVTGARNKLGVYMNKVATDALDEVEAILFVADALCGVRERDSELIARLAHAKAPLIACVNKIDAAGEERTAAATAVLKESGVFQSVLPVSGKRGDGLDLLEKTLAAYAVVGPQYFPEDMVTDQPERIICGELIREKALLLLREEVPHGVGVGVDKIELREDGVTDIYATIYCERDSHKGIIIGKGGAMLRRIGTEARQDIEWLLGTHVNLQLWIKVKNDWRNNTAVLRELGYE